MQIEIKIDPTCPEPKIVVITDRMTDEIDEIVKKITARPSPILAGYKDGTVTVLDPNRIFRIFASNGKVWAETETGEYTVRPRLYEIEQRLEGKPFVRISGSEILNLEKVKGFDLSFSGTICVSLSNGRVTYVSRRYVAKIKHLLGL